MVWKNYNWLGRHFTKHVIDTYATKTNEEVERNCRCSHICRYGLLSTTNYLPNPIYILQDPNYLSLHTWYSTDTRVTILLVFSPCDLAPVHGFFYPAFSPREALREAASGRVDGNPKPALQYSTMYYCKHSCS